MLPYALQQLLESIITESHFSWLYLRVGGVREQKEEGEGKECQKKRAGEPNKRQKAIPRQHP